MAGGGNPYHDAKGLFSSGSGGSTGGALTRGTDNHATVAQRMNVHTQQARAAHTQQTASTRAKGTSYSTKMRDAAKSLAATRAGWEARDKANQTGPYDPAVVRWRASMGYPAI
jgi:hypothetical protein